MTTKASATNQSPGVDWDRIRAQFEVGGTFRGLAKVHKVSHVAIQKRAAKEGWAQDSEPAIQRKVTEKVTGAVTTGNPKLRAEAIDAEAERRAEVILKQRGECNTARGMLYVAANADKVATTAKARSEAHLRMKTAKLFADGLRVVQELERKAHRLDDVPGGGASAKIEVSFVDEGADHDDEE